MTARFAAASALLVGLAGGLRADDPDVPAPVKRAIKGGREYLHAVYKPGGPGPGGFPGGGVGPGGQLMPLIPRGAPGMGHNTGIGSAALAGLALLESGAPATDAAVVNITKALRQSGILSLTGTYEVALVVMFLDQLGAKEDEPLIQFLTLRLLSGQNADGSWTYQCDRLQLNPVEERQLWAELTRDAKLSTPDAATPRKKGGPREDLDDRPRPKEEPKKEEPKEEPKGLHPALKKLTGPWPAAAPPGAPGAFPGVTSGDHSNTQFATVGLWCGRRHGVDVNDALGAIDKHYRACQAADGGWAYSIAFGGGSSSPAMTCAGLMGLAIGFGAKNLPGAGKDGAVKVDPGALNKDPAVTAGLKYVGDFIAAAGLQQRDPRFGGPVPDDLSRNLYFMWSLERVGMVYGLTTMGKVDWYEWGSKILVATQQRDGSWASDGFHSGSPDNATAFALLFLGRANLAEDLTARLGGKVRDPGTSRLIRVKDLDALLEKAGKPTSSSHGGTSAKRADGAKPTQPRTDTAPAADRDPAAKLAKALVEAGAAERADLIAKYRDTKGGEYTDALAKAAARLTGEAHDQVRAALAQRLTRMKPITLNEYMRDRDREVRCAAALAAGSKNRDQLPDLAEALIGLVADPDSQVAQAARGSLKKLTDEDFGPPAGAAPADRVQALTAWKKWWDEHKK
jgi:hypothetical protein